ncbi:hypothetical protein BYT27DRAFT_7191045 [Phlegmacium glaucopus]|nr:hypothetical protein BYT27DRAFT_7191045 [Phlegmacium glaucopus]
MTTLMNHSVTDHPCPSSDTEDELLLSPGKHETNVRTNHFKRSASPPPQDEYSPLSGSPSDGRKPKRVKRDLGLEDNESDRANLKSADLHQHSTRGHARNLSDSEVLTRKRSTRKRSATTTKKPVSTVSASPTPSTFSPVIPTEKGRAQSVPLFASFNDILRIDFRNPPPSPKRSRSRSPSKDRELKFRMTSSFSKLVSIPDEASSAMEVLDEPGNTLKATELLLPPKITDESDPKASIRETSVLSPTLLSSNIHITFSEIPSTPLAKQSLNKLMPMSPLTPLPETPFPGRLGTDVEDRYTGNIGWGVPVSSEVNASAQTTKPLLGIVASTSRSRLPRPSLAPPSTSYVKSTSTTVPASTSSTSNKNNTGTAKKKEELTVPKPNAFTLLMKKPMEAKQRMKEKAEKEQAGKVLHQALKAGPSTSSQPPKPEKQKVTAKKRMRGKQKEKPQKTGLFIPDEEEEDSHSEAELPTPHVDHSRFVASSTSPEPYSSTQGIETSTSKDAVMASLSEIEVKNGDMVMSEQKASDDCVMPHIGDTEATAVVPSEMVVETAPLQPSVPLLLEENASSKNEPTALVPSESGTLRPKAEISKLPRGKRRQPASVPIVDRVTRSVSLKQKGTADTNPQPVSAASATKGKPGGLLPVPAKRTASGSIKGPLPAQGEQHAEKTPLPPGSPMKLSSPPNSTKLTDPDNIVTDDGVRTVQTGAGQPLQEKPPVKSRIPVKPILSPSPNKLARTISRFSSNPDVSGLTRSFSMGINNHHTGAGSSLSTLSNALEKLRMPPPSRPNTSMGFNRDGLGEDDDNFVIPTRSKDDETVGRVSLGMGRSDTGLKRAATLGASSFKSLGVDADVSSSSKASGVTKKPLVQKSLAMFMGAKAGTAGGPQPVAGANMRGGIRAGPTGRGSGIFGVGRGLRRTISKKTSLPSVMASPVKGGGTDGGSTDEIIQDTIEDADQDAQTHRIETLVAEPTTSNDVLQLDELEIQGPSKSKEKSSTFGFNVSRRVSMVSQALSQSLNALPQPPQSNTRGLMGPPATPPASGRTGIRSSSSTYPSTSTSGDSPSQPGTSIGTRSSARIAKTAPGALMKIKGGTGGHVSSGRKGAAEVPTPNPAPETLKILNDCTIFVDVRTDDGDEAGSLFIDMLGGVGARVLSRVGQTCTHIVFKNGLMSTLTRYRMLRDPKPLVVGIAWVVECVEQRKRVDETKFLVDVEDMQYGTGTSKRRRSMLPRLLPSGMTIPSDTEREDGDADQSIDGSSSSMIIDEVLPPLELARRRKSMLLGPRP